MFKSYNHLLPLILSPKGFKMATLNSKVLTELFFGSLICIFLILTIPLSAPVTLTFLIWKKIITQYAMHVKNLHCMSGIDPVLIDKNLERPDEAILSALTFTGKPDLAALQKKFAQALEMKAVSENGNISLLYEKLRFYPQYWMGFFFWKHDDDFRIENHVRYLHMEKTRSCSEIVEALIKVPFKQNHPFWEVLVVRDFMENQFLVLCRFHHSLMDGYSALNFLLMGLSDNPIAPKYKEQSDSLEYKESFWKKIMRIVYILVAGPFVYAKGFYDIRDKNCLSLRCQPECADQTNTKDWFVNVTEPISLEKLKQTKKKLNVPLTALLLTGISSATEKFIHRKYGESFVPDKVSVMSAFYYPGHSHDRPINWFTMLPLILKFKIKDISERLDSAKYTFISAAKSVFPIACHFGLKIAGALPHELMLLGSKADGCTFLMTNMPGPTETLILCGAPLKEMFFCLPIMRNSCAMSIGIFSYNGFIRISVVGQKKCLKSSTNMATFTSLLHQELTDLIK